MKLDINKIETLAGSYCAQEMFAALMLQREFNNFNGRQVLTDLIDNADLWNSFIFAQAVYYDDFDGLSYGQVAKTLVALANHHIQSSHGFMDFVEYPADTLYILTENDDAKLSQLLEFKKKWQVDLFEVVHSPDVIAAIPSDFNWARQSLDRSLFNENCWDRQDGVMVTYWWD